MANEFLPFASGVSANVLTPAEYAALTSIVSDGFQSGILASERLNVVLRQATFVAAAIGQIVSDSGVNALDDGDLSGFATDIIGALRVFSPPPGSVIFGAMTTAPAGFIKANGATISRATYSRLFTAIGTTFGVGDGSTTFKIPDLRGEFLRGFDDSRGIDSGRVFGSWQKGTLVTWDDLSGLWGVSNDTTTASIATTQAAVGADAYTTTDYNTTLGLEGVVSTVSQALPGAAGAAWSGITRPRNIALLACIKY